MSPDASAPSPRQVAFWEKEDLGTYVYKQDGHFERPPGTAGGAQEHLKILDEKMKQIAREGTHIDHGVLGQATPGYVAAMRRQQYANAYTSFRHSQNGLHKNSGESRCRSFLDRRDSGRQGTDAIRSNSESSIASQRGFHAVKARARKNRGELSR